MHIKPPTQGKKPESKPKNSKARALPLISTLSSRFLLTEQSTASPQSNILGVYKFT